MPRHATSLGLLLLALCGAPACGSGGCDSTSRLATVLYGIPGDGVAGLTSRGCDGRTTVVIRPGSPRAREVSVVIHELYHVVGFREHADTPCYTSAVTQLTWPDEPCDEELALMVSAEGSFEIQSADPDLRSVVRDAILFWNGHVGRELFVLLP